jgi:hypothetical protein
MWIDPAAMTESEIEAELAALTGAGWKVEARKFRLTAELAFRDGKSSGGVSDESRRNLSSGAAEGD